MKTRKVTDAVAILHKRYIGNDPARLAELARERKILARETGLNDIARLPLSRCSEKAKKVRDMWREFPHG